MADAGPLIMAIGRIANDEEVSLEMRDIKIGAGGAAALASALKGNRRLTAADLYNTGIGEGGVEALASAMADGNGRVSVLDVGCNDLSLAGAAALARLIRARPLGTWEEPDEYGGPARQGLRELRLARNEVDAQACAALVSAEHAEGGSGKADGGGGGRGRGRGGGGGGREGGEPLLLTLRSLALSFNPLGDNGAAPLGRALLRCPELHSLQLCGCAIGAAGGAALADALHAARSLTHLDLSGNQLGDAGARTLAGAVPHAHVVELLLASNGVSDQGASALGLSLVRRARCPLRVLTLGSNSITDEGALALAEAISAPPPQRCRLAVLSLSANRLGPTAVAALGDAIVASPYLRTLHVSGNRRIGKADQEALESLLAQNRREHARLANAAGADPAAARPVQPNAAAKKLLRGHALNAYASDLTALPSDRFTAEKQALSKARAAPRRPAPPRAAPPRRVPRRALSQNHAATTQTHADMHPERTSTLLRRPRPQARAEQLGGLSSQLEEVRFAQAGAAGEVVVLQAKAEILERNLAEARARA